MSQMRRSRVESKETLSSALDSWAELAGDFEQVWWFGRKGFWEAFFRAEWFSGVIHTWYCGTEFSLCTIEGCCNIHTDMCGLLLSLLHGSVWKWHLQTRNTDNYSHILWESLI